MYFSHRSHLKKEPRPGNKIWWAANNLEQPPWERVLAGEDLGGTGKSRGFGNSDSTF